MWFETSRTLLWIDSKTRRSSKTATISKKKVSIRVGIRIPIVKNIIRPISDASPRRANVIVQRMKTSMMANRITSLGQEHPEIILYSPGKHGPECSAIVPDHEQHAGDKEKEDERKNDNETAGKKCAGHKTGSSRGRQQKYPR